MSRDSVTNTFEKIAQQIPLAAPEVNDFETRIKSFLKSASQTMMLSVSLDLINTNENIRDICDDNEFRSLMTSIKAAGVIQPPLLTIRGDVNKFELVCVAGHRRLAAAKALGHDKATCLIRKFQDNHFQLISTIVENTHRKNLHPFELAEGIRRLVETGYSFEELENLFDRNQWNLRRFNKMNDWTPLSKNLVKEHVSRFTSTWLLHLASRTLTPQEVELHIKAKLGLSDTAAPDKKEKNSIHEKAKTFFENRKLTEDQKNLIQEFMKDVGLVKEKAAKRKMDS